MISFLGYEEGQEGGLRKRSSCCHISSAIFKRMKKPKKSNNSLNKLEGNVFKHIGQIQMLYSADLFHMARQLFK